MQGTSDAFVINDKTYTTSDSTMFSSTSDTYDDTKVFLTNFTAARSTTSSSNDTLTITMTVAINKFTTSDLTYDLKVEYFAIQS